MEKGKRYDLPGIGRAHNCEATKDSSGPWLYDPDKAVVPFSKYSMAMARADCYEEQMKDLAVALENMEQGYKEMVKRKDILIASLEKQNERLSEMHKTEVQENRELWEENRRLKGE